MTGVQTCGLPIFVQTNTSALEEGLIKKIISLLPQSDFFYYYGLTEASRSTFISLSKNPDKINSVGCPLRGVEIKIIDEEGGSLKPMEIGQICIKGEHVVEGYWGNPEASNKIKNGWLYTGDAGFIDEDGFLYFSGRNGDIINVSGEKVMPEEIEGLARQFSGVQEAAATSVSDSLFGERVKLYIVPEKDSFDPELLMDYFKKNLEHHKIPKEIKIVEKIFYTDNGKLQRKKIKEYYA